MNRSEKLVRWLASQDGPRTSRQMREAVDPAADVKIIHAVISSMVKRGKMRRAGFSGASRRGTSLYALTEDAMRDNRIRAKPKPKPTTAQRVVVGRKAAKPQAVGDVSADVAAWMAAGGRVQRLGRHETSQPFKRIHPERAPNLEMAA